MVQGYSITLLDEIWTILEVVGLPFGDLTVKILNFIYFLNISQSVNINSSWPYTANSRMKQLTQLFLHKCIEALLTTSRASSQLGHMS